MPNVLTGIPYGEFVAIIGDIEHKHGMCIHTFGRVVRARLVRYARTVSGEPAVVYEIPGFDPCALIVVDPFTRQPYVKSWIVCGEHPVQTHDQIAA
jgi:hypothetical protein